MADRVDALVNPVKSPRLGPSRSGAVAYARCDELRTRNHAMLPSRNLGQEAVWVGAFLAHGAIKAPQPRVLPVLLEFQVFEGGPARVDGLLVFLVGGVV